MINAADCELAPLPEAVSVGFLQCKVALPSTLCSLEESCDEQLTLKKWEVMFHFTESGVFP